jgi:hypothetical protein
VCCLFSSPLLVDVKPSNIFVDAWGDCLLGDYDSGVTKGRPVVRTTASYLPAEFAELWEAKQLKASEAVDWAMLAVSLAERMGLPMAMTPSTAAASEGATSVRHAAAPSLFFSQPSHRRTLFALTAAVSEETFRVKALLGNAQITRALKLDMEARRCVLEAITAAVQRSRAGAKEWGEQGEVWETGLPAEPP